MNCIVISNKSYADDFRKYLIQAATEDGGVGIHIRCGANIEISTPNQPPSTFPIGTALQTLRLSLPQRLFFESSILLTGMNGFKSREALRLQRLFPNALSIFDVYDDFRYGAKGIRAYHWWRHDRQWRKQVDRVMVLEKGLMEKYPGAFHLDNASHVNRASDAIRPQKILKTVYVGSIDRRTDFSLLRLFVEKGFQLDVHGGIHDSRPEAKSFLEDLRRYPNFTYHGAYANDNLEDILSAYNVGILPYVTDSVLTRHINPDKFYHYLNAGLEVLTTSIPQAKRLSRFVHLIENSQQLLPTVEQIETHRRSLAWPRSEYTWAKRWEQLRGLAASNFI